MKTFIWGMHDLNGHTTLSQSEGDMFFAVSANNVEEARENAREIANQWAGNTGLMIQAIIKEEPTILELGQYISLEGADY